MALIGKTIFRFEDQIAFADYSGDQNPIHIDPSYARRLASGYNVVHGIHGVLRAFEFLYRSNIALDAINSFEITFEKMIFVGDIVSLHFDSVSGELALWTDGAKVTEVKIVFGDYSPAPKLPGGETICPNDPIDQTNVDLAGLAGTVPLGSAHSDDLFPHLARRWGHARIGALAATSYLVGMVCPGLHSLYAGLSVLFQPDAGEAALNFKVLYASKKMPVVKMAFSGPGLAGQITSLKRPPPVVQAGLLQITDVAPAEFAHARALVVGGSRGLGELVAKLLVAGGAKVAITYSVGLADANRLKRELNEAGKDCDILRLDITKDIGAQLPELPFSPNCLFYMASPPIFARNTRFFSREKLDHFQEFYAFKFYDLVMALRSTYGQKLAIFYPSSVAVSTRPANMTEYSMAKSAGEILCADMMAFDEVGSIVVSRLPRLPTDQTASITPAKAEEPVATMLPIVRSVCETIANAAGALSRVQASPL